MPGRVRQVAPTVDARNRTALVYVDLPRSPQLKAGMFAHGSFDLGATLAVEKYGKSFGLDQQAQELTAEKLIPLVATEEELGRGLAILEEVL